MTIALYLETLVARETNQHPERRENAVLRREIGGEASIDPISADLDTNDND